MKRFVFVLFAFVLTLAACKKSVEGETSKFESNKESLSELMAIYPGFEIPLDEAMIRGEKLWEDAQGISGEEEQIEKMAEANTAMTGGFVSKLKSVDRKLETLSKKMSEMNRVATDRIDRNSAASVSDGANITINNAQETLRNGADDAVTATTILNRVSKNLDRSVRDCKRVTDSARAKKKKGKNSKNVAGGSDKATDGGGTKTASSWKCGYCSKKNPASAHECSGCGAQH